MPNSIEERNKATPAFHLQGMKSSSTWAIGWKKCTGKTWN